jgi:hypothetical protein
VTLIKILNVVIRLLGVRHQPPIVTIAAIPKKFEVKT